MEEITKAKIYIIAANAINDRAQVYLEEAKKRFVEGDIEMTNYLHEIARGLMSLADDNVEKAKQILEK